MNTELLKFNENAYVHKMAPNELGYRNGKPGGAGRFIYIAKKLVGFFPPLSEVVLNDHIFINVISPFSDDIVLSNYIYHNSKTADLDEASNRNEYRLYLNSRNDTDRDYYKPEDIIVIVKFEDQEDEYYKIIRLKPDEPEYLILNARLEEKNINHLFVPLNELTFIESLRKVNAGNKVIPKEIIDEALKEPVYHAPTTPEEESDTTRVLRSRSFRDLVLYFYDFKCAVTGKKLFIDYKDFNNLEAAHILARASGGGSNPSNGMALERNLHWAFDKGFFTIEDDYTVVVHPDAMRIEYLKEKHGAKLLLPEDTRTIPDKTSLKWHRENVFGMFLKSQI